MQHDNKITRNVADAALKILMGEEPDNQQFTQELDKAKTKASEKKSPEDEARVASPKVQASINVPDSGVTVKEELKGGQKNIDMNKNNKIDAEDFKMLRAKKKPAKRVVHSDKPDRLVSMKVSKEEVESLEEGKLKDMVTKHMDDGHSFDTAMKKAQSDLDKIGQKAAAADKKVQKDNLKKTMSKSMQKENSTMSAAFQKMVGSRGMKKKNPNVTNPAPGVTRHKAKLAAGPKYGDSSKEVSEAQIDEGPIGATVGATGGAMLAGPVGAAVGGLAGHKIEKGIRSVGKRFKAAAQAFKRKPVNPENKEEYKPSFTDMLETYQEKGLGYINEINEDIELLDEKNKPTNPALWSRAKAAAKAKFDVYPSAYANGWAARWYKKRGGSWRSVKEEVELEEGKKKKHDCASKVKSEEYGIGYCIPEMHTMLEDGTVTHYDVEFDDCIVENFPVEELEILVSEMHKHSMNEEKNKQLHELSAKKLGSYTKKASQDLSNRRFDQGESEKRQYEPDEDDHKEEKKLRQREKGIKRAADKLVKKATNEEYDQIDEISAKTLGSYTKKASQDLSNRRFDQGESEKRQYEPDEDDEREEKRLKQREKGIKRAADKLVKKANEEYDQIEEGTPTKKQVKQGIGIARDKRYAKGNMSGAVKAMDKVNKGLAQHPAVAKELKKQNESFNFKDLRHQLDELSPKTLGSYSKKAGLEARSLAAYGAGNYMMDKTKEAKQQADKSDKRMAGVKRATDKLVKKANEEVEQIDELKTPTLKRYIDKAEDRQVDAAMDKKSNTKKFRMRDLSIAKAKGRLSMNRQLGRAEESVQINEFEMETTEKGKKHHYNLGKKQAAAGKEMGEVSDNYGPYGVHFERGYRDHKEAMGKKKSMKEDVKSMKKVAKQLRGASKMHLAQSKKVEKHVKSMSDVKEGHMTDAQMDKREKIVMAMKPKMQSFKDRYGKDAKSVMYATATKQAMREEIEEYDYIFESEYLKLSEEEQQFWEKVGEDDYDRLLHKKKQIPAKQYGQKGKKSKVLDQIRQVRGTINTRSGESDEYSEKGRKSDYATDFKVGKKDRAEMIYRKKSGRTGQIPSQRAEVRRDKSYDI